MNFLPRILLLLSSVFIQPQGAQGRQSFEDRPLYTEVNPGDDTILLCRIFEKSRNSDCIWQKDGKPIRMQPGKYEWDGIKESGDCSLRLIGADIEYDDGMWECQVSPSTYDANDALSSNPARLIVRVPPSDPRIYYDDQYLTSEPSIHIPAGRPVRVRCESRNGNPPPALRWFIEEEEIPGSSQTNETGNSRLFNAISNVELILSKDDNQKNLKCVAFHEAYSRKMREIRVQMDVLYAPIVTLEKNRNASELEALVDDVSFRCLTDANPPASVYWRKAGGESRYPSTEYLTFEPVRQGDEGTYFCMAQNDIGSSDELSISFEVLYPPRNMEIAPSSRSIDLRIGSSATFHCSADGNPNPEIEWNQRILTEEEGEQIFSRGNGHSFDLNNASYKDQGEWSCAAFNAIKGQERKIHGSYFDVNMVGSPEIRFPLDSLSFTGGFDASIKALFCSDPKQEELRWIWGSLELFEGQRHGRFYVPPIERKMRDCYETELVIEDALAEDSRIYYLMIRNEENSIRTGIRISISEPFSLSAVLGAGISGLILLILLSCIVILLLRKRNTPLCKVNSRTERPKVYSQGASTDNLHEYIERSVPDLSSNVITVTSLPPPSTNITVQKPPLPPQKKVIPCLKTPPNVQYADIHFRKKYSYLTPKKATPGHFINFNGLPHPSTVTFQSGRQADV
uniref:Ig-like domain-containing protein n=2 Tax=Lepeophtheirus salmonis TaxID=72036 RepID=A0A0K2SZJ5_LEPSM